MPELSEHSCNLCGKVISFGDLPCGPSAKGLAVASEFSDLISKNSKQLSTAEAQFLAFIVDKHFPRTYLCSDCRGKVEVIREHYENQTEEEAIAEDEAAEWTYHDRRD